MASILDMLPSRRGHFRLESGLHSDLWIDFEPLFISPRSLDMLVADLAAKLHHHHPTAICGPFVGGAFLAQARAHHLGLRFYFTERRPDQGGALFSARYELPTALAARMRGERVAVVDEAISAGSSVRATIASVRAAGGVPIAVGTLLLLGTVGVDHFRSAQLPVVALGQEPLATWSPADCPLCRAGEPTVDLASRVQPFQIADQ